VKAILQSVSRSFYLTIKFLPRPLREPISLAYLLARATDTIADTASIAVEIRLTNLLSLARVIAGELDFAAIAEPLRTFAAQQSDPAERKLIERPGAGSASFRRSRHYGSPAQYSRAGRIHLFGGGLRW
jgi:farnesyl-diphosphate farnesyltransferase